MQDKLGEFEKCGAALIALCPQRQEFNETLVAKLNLGFPVLQDQDNLVATAFGLTLETPPDVIEAERFLGLDLPAHNGTNNWDLPIPSRYVLDRSSAVKYASLHVDHRMRCDPKECLDLLKSL